LNFYNNNLDIKDQGTKNTLSINFKNKEIRTATITILLMT